jgi:hypothetical protein
LGGEDSTGIRHLLLALVSPSTSVGIAGVKEWVWLKMGGSIIFFPFP